MLFEDGVDPDNPLYTEAWVAEYRSIGDALDETGVVTRNGEVVHRNEGDGTPFCYADDGHGWKVVETDEARKSGYVPCRGCYAAIFDYLADREHSRVRYAGEPVGEVDTPTTLAADGGVAAAPETLSSRTEEVLVTTDGSTTTYHAPAGDGGPLCNTDGTFRRVERVALAGHKDACTDCFDTEAIDTSTP